MFKSLLNVFRIPELRNKVLFTLFMLMVYRIGYHVPLPGVDQTKLADLKKSQGQGDDSPFNQIANYVSLFSGGDLQQSTIFGLGIMPYISASIIFQLLATVIPALEKLQKEGESGRRKVQEWMRYATVPLCIIQAIFWLNHMQNPNAPMVLPVFHNEHALAFWVMSLCALTAGCIFLMWLGEQIEEYGLGNGVSLIIMAGIVARMPQAIFQVVGMSGGGENSQMSPGKIIFLALSFVFIVTGAILITQAQRRIPIQQAKQTRGRKIYGGARQYLPLRVNHGGVMPIIFAQSLMMLPLLGLGYIANAVDQAANHQPGVIGRFILFIHSEFAGGKLIYVLLEMAMIYFFAYFWTTVQFQPKEMANQLRDYGSFIPGLRPGKRTADYLERVMMRITYVGAGFLCIIATIPTVIATALNIPYHIAQFLGGTGLLISVSVALDMVQRIEANLLMRNYGGFLGEGAKRIKGRQY